MFLRWLPLHNFFSPSIELQLTSFPRVCAHKFTYRSFTLYVPFLYFFRNTCCFFSIPVIFYFDQFVEIHLFLVCSALLIGFLLVPGLLFSSIHRFFSSCPLICHPLIVQKSVLFSPFILFLSLISSLLSCFALVIRRSDWLVLFCHCLIGFICLVRQSRRTFVY